MKLLFLIAAATILLATCSTKKTEWDSGAQKQEAFTEENFQDQGDRMQTTQPR